MTTTATTPEPLDLSATTQVPMSRLARVEFRKSLLARIEQLEKHDADKTERLATQSRRIAELEHENRNLRSEVASLKASRA